MDGGDFVSLRPLREHFQTLFPPHPKLTIFWLTRVREGSANVCEREGLVVVCEGEGSGNVCEGEGSARVREGSANVS